MSGMSSHILSLPSTPRPAADRLITPAEAVLLTAAAALGLGTVLLRSLGLDETLFLALNGWFASWPAAALLWSSLSVLGLGLSAFLLLAIACGTTVEAQRLRPLAALLCGFPIGGALTHLLKHTIDAPRPAAVLPAEQFHLIGSALQHGSMPSGHSVTAFATLVIVLGCWQLGRAGRLGAVLLAVAVALSRIATAAHWPSDVLAGAGLGLLTGLLVLRLVADGRRSGWLLRARGVPLALLQCGCGVAMCLIQTGYPAAVPLQWLLGSTAALAGLLRLARLLPLAAGACPSLAGQLDSVPAELG
jgi:membrane-associated phospholipid phosphatase